MSFHGAEAINYLDLVNPIRLLLSLEGLDELLIQGGLARYRLLQIYLRIH